MVRFISKIIGRQTNLSAGRLLALVLLCTSLFACSSENVSDLQSYVSKVKARPGRAIAPLPPVESYESYQYPVGLRDPFVASRPDRCRGKNCGKLHKAQCTPPRDVLEQFALETLTMVGSLEQKGQLWALVKAADGTLYRTKKGKCIGQDDGKIVKITESEIILKEYVADGLGSYIERKTVIGVRE